MAPKCSACSLSNGCLCPCIEMEKGTETWPVVLFIGEAPGEEEDKVARPFVGRTGKLLRSLIADVLPECVPQPWRPWISNAVSCRPPGNRTPEAAEIKACKPRIVEDINTICNPDAIFLLGASALKSVMGMAGIKAIRGQRLTYALADGRTIPVFPVFHPSYITRFPDNTKQWVEDFQRAFSYIMNPPTQLPVPYEETDILTLCKEVHKTGRITFDIESNMRLDPYPADSRLIWLGAGTRTKGGRILVAGGIPSCMSEEQLGAFAEVMSNPSIMKGNHNLKFDIVWGEQKLGWHVTGPLFCTLVAYHVGVNEETAKGLKSLAYQYTDWGGYEDQYKELTYNLQTAEKDSDFLSEEGWNTLRHYNFMDVSTSIVVQEETQKALNKDKQKLALFNDMLMPELRMLANVEQNGIAIDVKLLREYRILAAKRTADFLYDAWAVLRSSGLEGSEKYALWFERGDYAAYNDKPRKVPEDQVWMNLASPIHKRDIAHNIFRLPVLKTTPEGEPSFEDDVVTDLLKQLERAPRLEWCEEQGLQFMKLFQAWQAIETIKKMFLNKYPGFLDEECLVHPKYNQALVVTLRLSSERPNLQQVPRNPKGESLTKEFVLRNLFVSRFAGGKIIGADYSQIELRWAAILSGDPTMIEFFKSGKQYHLLTAKLMAPFWGVDPEICVKGDWIYDRAKTVNFGILYGKSDKGFAEEFGTSVEEAHEFIDRYFARFPLLKLWLDNTAAEVKAKGKLRGVFGFERHLGSAKSGNRGAIANAIRQAVNFRPQNAAGQMTVEAMVRVESCFAAMNSRALLVGNGHDQILIDSPPEEVESICSMVKREMEDWDLAVPIVVEITVGDSWGSGEEWISNGGSHA